MPDRAAAEQSPLVLLEPVPAERSRPGLHSGRQAERDPSAELIDQLWEVNPYSKLLPIDPDRVTEAFQPMATTLINLSRLLWFRHVPQQFRRCAA